MATKKETKNYDVKYRILDEPGIREMYHGVSALSVAQATDRAEKILISDGLPFASFEIVKVEVATTDEEANQACKDAVKKNQAVRDKIASEKQADAALEKASRMSKAELFLRELRAEDEDDYNVLRDRVAALVEESSCEAVGMSLYQLYELTNKIEGIESTPLTKEFNGFKSLDDKKPFGDVDIVPKKTW